MELCTAGAVSKLLPHNRLFSADLTPLQWKTSLPVQHFSFRRTSTGLPCYSNPYLESTTSEETSTGSSQYVGKKTDGSVTIVEEDQPIEMNSAYTVEAQEEVAERNSPMDGQMQAYEILDKLDLKLDSEDAYSYILFGGGALVALWLATAVVGAIDSIPLFPKLLEVVGLAYTLWFSTRYLIFKKNREELAFKIEEIKQRVFG